MKHAPRNLAASVLAKLANIAGQSEEGYNLLLVRFVAERLLFRLASSEHTESFVLKGAMLFLLWGSNPHRPTRDIDLLGFGEPDAERLAGIFRFLCAASLPDDGVNFEAESVIAEEIRALDQYGGIRVTLRAKIGNAQIPMQIDVGFGDAMTPAPTLVSYPTILDFPAPRLRAYGRETVVAEKIEAIAKFGMINTRFKDYFDLRELAESQPFDGALIQKVIRATFQRSGTLLPTSMPIGLTDTFAEDATKQRQWTAFCSKINTSRAKEPLRSAIKVIASFVGPPMTSPGRDPFVQMWAPGGPWK